MSTTENNKIDRQMSNRVYVRKEATEKDDDGCCRSCTNKLNRVLENIFASIGYAVGNNPLTTIFICLVCCALCFIGVIEYQVENRGDKNWVSQTSDAIKHKNWVDEEFPAAFRNAYIILERKDGSDKILQADSIRELRRVDLVVRSIYKNTPKRRWDDICYTTGAECVPKSILELWSYNDTVINGLNDTDVLNALKKKNFTSDITGQKIEIDTLIGETKTRDPKTGYILSGSALKISYRLRRNEVFDSSTGRLVDDDGEAWEKMLEETLVKLPKNDHTVYSFSLWSNDKAAGDASNGDLQFFVVGYILVIVYLSLVLGSFSRLNQKVYLAISGIITIGLSIGVAYGLGSGFQLKATPVHNVLPFLLLGIGVDDIFVIVQCWDNINGPKRQLSDVDHRSIAEKVSLTLRHAGVSVLVTSLTDVCAFLIGASTILPALRSFCIWCGIGILSVFILTLTFFTALLALDARRQQKNRDACCCCCVTLKEDWTPMECSKKNRLQDFMKNVYGPCLISIPGKIIGMLIVAGLLAGGIYAVAEELEQDFDFKWFLPSDSRPRMYTEKDEMAFPNDGFFGNVYTGKLDYYNDFEVMYKIENTLKNTNYIVPNTVVSWYSFYHNWLNLKSSTLGDQVKCNKTTGQCQASNETMFYKLLLNDFLNDPQGKFFNGSIKRVNGKIVASKIGYIHEKFAKAADEIKGMEAVQEEINPKKISNGGGDLLPFAFSRFYISWETNKVISEELGRNLGLAMLCVFLVTLFLLSNIWASLMVLICVVLALVDITGFMAFWGLTIDTVTTIIMVIAIGLTVDYSAHIAHGFMASREGDKNERMKNALATVGPAVVNGAFSTFLAFVLLAASTSYVFKTFFQVFFLVVLFGMLHGLVFLPIILSVVGPRPYAAHDDDDITPQVNNAYNKEDNGEVPMDKIRKDEEVFVVVENGKGGSENVSYVPEDKD